MGAAWFLVARFPFESSVVYTTVPLHSFGCTDWLKHGLICLAVGWRHETVLAAVIRRASPGPNLRYHYVPAVFSQLMEAFTW